MSRLAGKKVGLALGAGAARGWAHIGVVRALEEQGVEVSCVAGASAGALVGSAYAAGQLDALEAFVREIDLGQVLRYFSDISFKGSGLVDGAGIVTALDEVIGPVAIEDFPMAFRAVATDLEQAEAVIFDKGPAARAVRSSISFPGVFTPVEHEGRFLVDGGLVNPVPVSVVKEMGADYVIAVDVNQGRTGSGHRERKRQKRHDRFRERWGISKEDSAYRLYKKLESRFSRLKEKIIPSQPRMLDILGDSIKILEARVAQSMLEKDPPDLLIRPDVGFISFMDFNLADAAIEEGYLAATASLKPPSPRL